MEITAEIQALLDKQKEELESKFQKDNEGLVNKVNELLGEKKSEAEKRKIAEETAKIEAAKKSGEIETLEKTLRQGFESERKSLSEEIELLKSSILNGKKSEALTEASAIFISPDIGRVMLGQLIDVDRTDSGVVTKYKNLNGEVVTTNFAEFKEYLKSNDTFKSLLKGADSSGGGANGGHSGDGRAKSLKEMTATEEAQFANENPEQYKRMLANIK